MADGPENGADGTRVAGEGDPGVAIIFEDVVEQSPHADGLSRARLAKVGSPKRILLRETLFEDICREILVNPGLATATITSVESNAFAKELPAQKSAD